MKKLSDYKNGQALDLLVEILEPCVEIMADEEVIDKIQNGSTRMEGVKLMIGNHKRAVISILAALDGVPVSEYEFGFFTLPMRLMEVITDKELLGFFMDAQIPSTDSAFGSAMENTEEHGE